MADVFCFARPEESLGQFYTQSYIKLIRELRAKISEPKF